MKPKFIDKFKEDLKKGGSLVHEAIKSAKGGKREFVQPTHTIRTEKGITSQPSAVHQAFEQEWSEQVFKPQRE